MNNHQQFSHDIKTYSDGWEIMDCIDNDELLREAYEEIRFCQPPLLQVLVIAGDRAYFEHDLHILEKPGLINDDCPLKYYFIPDFINRKTNLMTLLDGVCQSVAVSNSEVLGKIIQQLDDIYSGARLGPRPRLSLLDDTVFFNVRLSAELAF